MITETIEILKAFKAGATIELNEDNVHDIYENVEKLISDGLIYSADGECFCTVCGAKSSFYILVKGDDGTAMCLECATGTKLNGNILYICAKRHSLKLMNTF